MSTQLKGDDRLAVLFRNHATQNEARTLSEGRPMFDDIEVVDIRAPGSRNVSTFPATAVSHWSSDQYGGNQVQVTYAERFAHQYRQFKSMQAQTISGTPLQFVPFLTEGRRAELRAQNIYTAEQLAGIDGNELKNLGPGGRDLKNAAAEYIKTSQEKAPDLQLKSELEQMRARNAVLEEDLKAARERAPSAEPQDEFEDMSMQQLRDMVTNVTGHAPYGNLNRKTLARMIKDHREKAA